MCRGKASCLNLPSEERAGGVLDIGDELAPEVPFMEWGQKRVWLTMAMLLGLCVVQPSGEARAQAWRGLQPADFPARVRAILFDKGVLSGQTERVWGHWTVRFGSDLPVARYVNCDNSVCPSFRVENLACANDVVGESRCMLSVAWRLAFGDAICALYIEQQRMEIPVGCPTDLRFK